MARFNDNWMQAILEGADYAMPETMPGMGLMMGGGQPERAYARPEQQGNPFGALVSSMPQAQAPQFGGSPDPYAAIRRLPASFGHLNRSQVFVPQHADEAHQDPIPVLNADGSPTYEYDTREYTDRVFGAGSPLAPFQSKFGFGRKEDDGSFLFNLQKPGGHKYDLLEARYTLDPATGELVMQGDPGSFRRQSSLTTTLQGAGKVAAFVGGGALLAPIAAGGLGLGGMLGGGILGNAAAGALVGGGGALLGGSDSEGALRGAITGAIAAGSGAAMQGQGWTGGPASFNQTGLTPAAIDAGLGTPGYGYNAGAAASGLFDPGMIGAGANLGQIPTAPTAAPADYQQAFQTSYGDLGSIDPAPLTSQPSLQSPGDVFSPNPGFNAPSFGSMPEAFNPGAAESAPQGGSQPAEFRPSQNYGEGMSGNQTSTYDNIIGATGSPGLANAGAGAAGGLDAIREALGPAGSWIRDNPTLARLIVSAGGGLLGAMQGPPGGGGGNAAAPAGPPVQWTTGLQMGIQPQAQQWQPTLNSPDAIRARGGNGAARFFTGG